MPTKPTIPRRRERNRPDSPLAFGKLDTFRARASYTTGDLAVLFSVSPQTVATRIDRGLLPGALIPGSQHRRVAHEELVGWLHGHPECKAILDRLRRAERAAAQDDREAASP